MTSCNNYKPNIDSIEVNIDSVSDSLAITTENKNIILNISTEDYALSQNEDNFEIEYDNGILTFDKNIEEYLNIIYTEKVTDYHQYTYEIYIDLKDSSKNKEKIAGKSNVDLTYDYDFVKEDNCLKYIFTGYIEILPYENVDYKDFFSDFEETEYGRKRKYIEKEFIVQI